MKNLSSWLIAMFAFMFWAFRVVATVMYSMGKDFIAAPPNGNIAMEIVLLFVTFICICLITARKLLPTLIYLIAHALYYGIYLYQNVLLLIDGTASMNSYIDLLVALVGIAIPLFAFFDVLLDRNRKAHPTDKKTDWFYKNAEYDRKMDERADKNQYRTL